MKTMLDHCLKSAVRAFAGITTDFIVKEENQDISCNTTWDTVHCLTSFYKNKLRFEPHRPTSKRKEKNKNQKREVQSERSTTSVVLQVQKFQMEAQGSKNCNFYIFLNSGHSQFEYFNRCIHFPLKQPDGGKIFF